MLARLSPWTRAYLGLVAFSLAGSLFSRLAHLDPGPIAPIAAFLTLALGATAAFEPYLRANPHRGWLALVLVLTLGTTAELIGVATGYPFGHYAYTDRWLPVVSVPGVGWFPLQVPIAWLLVVGASTLAVDPGPLSAWRAAITAGALAAILDLVMEPVMAGPLHYWKWLVPGPLPGGAPFLNSLGWFATAGLGAAVMLSFGAAKVERIQEARTVLAAHLLLTLGIGAILAL